MTNHVVLRILNHVSYTHLDVYKRQPLGSGYLGRFYTMKQPGLIFGPDEYGNYLYFWITNSGINGYLGYSDIPGFIKSRITEPLIPPKEDFADNTADYVLSLIHIWTGTDQREPL